jgi:hypothetical protein
MSGWMYYIIVVRICKIGANLQVSLGTFFTRVGTYVHLGSSFCYVILADTLLKILYYCSISPSFQHIAPLNAALPGSLAEIVQVL